MDAPVKSTQYLPLRADFQYKYRCNILLPLVCCVEGSLKNGLVLRILIELQWVTR
jgi:hypothetical protein